MKLTTNAMNHVRPIGKDGRTTVSVGNTVNLADATYDNSIGAVTLGAYWKDPSFDPNQRAFYYARVIEIPTPTFLAYDRKFYSIKEMPEDTTYVSQERAWSSPIWYAP